MSTNGKLFQAEWLEYRNKLLIPAGASAGQIIEIRRAFYAGAHAYNCVVMAALGPGGECTPEEEAVLAGMISEITAFWQQVKDGIA